MTSRMLLCTCMMALSGCASSKLGDCQFWEPTKTLSVEIRGATYVRYPRVKLATLSRVQSCYERHPYVSREHYLSFGEQRNLPDGRRLLTFTIDGVSDVKAGVITDRDDQILQGGLVSLVTIR